jgi:subtilisin family serine protease
MLEMIASRTGILAAVLAAAVCASAAPSSYLVRYKGTAPDAMAAVSRAGGVVTTHHAAVNLLVAKSGEARFEGRLAGESAVDFVVRDERFRLLPLPRSAAAQAAPAAAVTGLPQNASQLNRQWNLFTVQANLAWERTLGHRRVKVAVLDSGICTHQVDMEGRVDASASASFVPAAEECAATVEPACVGCPLWEDRYFHGTHVAGQISTNGVATASVAPNVTLRAIKIANCLGESEWSWIIAGILYAAHTGNDVANISFSALVNPHSKMGAALLAVLKAVIAYARVRGTLVVASAGNDGRDLDKGGKLSLPCEAGALCVGATTRSDRLADFSNHGDKAVPILAPGGGVPLEPYPRTRDNEFLLGPCSRHSTVFPGCGAGTGSFILLLNGTSVAAPHVAGAAAMVDSIAEGGPGAATPLHLERTLLRAADEVDAGRRLNVYRAVR